MVKDYVLEQLTKEEIPTVGKKSQTKDLALSILKDFIESGNEAIKVTLTTEFTAKKLAYLRKRIIEFGKAHNVSAVIRKGNLYLFKEQ